VHVVAGSTITFPQHQQLRTPHATPPDRHNMSLPAAGGADDDLSPPMGGGGGAPDLNPPMGGGGGGGMTVRLVVVVRDQHKVSSLVDDTRSNTSTNL
jgi:hypothetical protein